MPAFRGCRFPGGGRAAGLALAALLASAAGCSPLVTYQIDTVVDSDGEVSRKTMIFLSPGEPPIRAKASDYVVLPPKKDYAQYEASDARVALGGIFAGFGDIPADIRARTPEGCRPTGNKAWQRTFDMVLFHIDDYEERIDDGVNYYEAEATLEAFWDWALPEAAAVIEAALGAEYDCSEFIRWMRADGLALTRRAYALAWEIRRARRGGIAGESEDMELRRRAWGEIRRLGVPVVDTSEPDAELINQERLLAWLDARLAQWCRPRRPGTPPLTAEWLGAREQRAMWRKAALETLAARHGSLENAIERARPWLPRLAGTFGLAEFVSFPTLARYRFNARWLLPGWPLHTNGNRDFDGALRWDFTGREVLLSGYTMWARMVRPNAEAVRALGLAGFPDRIVTMERYIGLLFEADRRAPRSAVAAALRHCVRTSGLEPLAALAAGEPGLAARPGDAEAARQLMDLLGGFRQASAAPGAPRDAARY